MKCKRKRFVLFVLLVCLVICGPGVGAGKDNVRPNSLNPDRVNQDGPEQSGLNDTLFDGFLYFADTRGGYLKALPKQFASNLDAHELGRKILEAVLEGPPDSVLTATFPKDTQVRALFISEDGRAWVDLGIGEGRLKNMDTVSERLAIYSLVNSLTLNIPGVKQVKLLVNGSDVASLGGHVSLKYFYKTNMLIVK
jgi:spore germination protein GerM